MLKVPLAGTDVAAAVGGLGRTTASSATASQRIVFRGGMCIE